MRQRARTRAMAAHLPSVQLGTPPEQLNWRRLRYTSDWLTSDPSGVLAAAPVMDAEGFWNVELAAVTGVAFIGIPLSQLFPEVTLEKRLTAAFWGVRMDRAVEPPAFSAVGLGIADGPPATMTNYNTGGPGTGATGTEVIARTRTQASTAPSAALVSTSTNTVLKHQLFDGWIRFASYCTGYTLAGDFDRHVNSSGGNVDMASGVPHVLIYFANSGVAGNWRFRPSGIVLDFGAALEAR